MYILEELRKDRVAATHIRSSLAAECHIVFFDMEWNDVTEECIWQFLVHEEFKVWDVRRGLTCPCTQESLRCLGHALPTRTQACHGLASVVRAVAISMAMSVFSRS